MRITEKQLLKNAKSAHIHIPEENIGKMLQLVNSGFSCLDEFEKLNIPNDVKPMFVTSEEDMVLDEDEVRDGNMWDKLKLATAKSWNNCFAISKIIKRH